MKARSAIFTSMWFLLFTFTLMVRGAEMQVLRGHVPNAVKTLQPTSSLSATNRLSFAICLPLRNTDALTNLLGDIYNPASPNYRHFLTPEQFAAQFGPSETDAQVVSDFAKANGFTVTKIHPNRTLVDVSASVADVEKAFHVTMHTYRHPTENRTFFAPDVEPSLALSVPISRISGLDNYSLPKPRYKFADTNRANATPNSSTGSGVNGAYASADFRAAYVPDTTLTGAGQSVGLLQFDGYSAADITAYEIANGLPSVTLTNVLLDGFNGGPTGNGGEVEVSLDIEMAIAMAPGLSSIIVYEAGPLGNWHDILNRMATDNLCRQLSCSWFIHNGTADTVADGIFQQMAAQGQSFFNASGDSDAFSGLISFPSDSPYITQVGGTTLFTSGPGGARLFESVWNRGNGVGSGGGISTQYAIPSWQTNISMAANLGSTKFRNVPDVALTAENVYVRANGNDLNMGGTSCAAPLWAGFVALVNQKAVLLGRPAIGFINPTLDVICVNSLYTNRFHDITVGDNTSSNSPAKYMAATGYDLCTGWGTPNGQNLINALVSPNSLLILQAQAFAVIGGVGGPFSVNSQTLSLTNNGTNLLNWTLSNTANWLDASPVGGSLTPGGSAAIVTVSLNAAASNLTAGTYTATLSFTNLNDNFSQRIQYILTVINPPVIITQPTNIAVLGGANSGFSAVATGGQPLFYQWRLNGTNLTDSSNLAGSATTAVTITNTSTNNVGAYSLLVSNAAGTAVSSNAVLALISSAPVITQQPIGQTVYVGSTVQFSVNVLGNKPFFYQWTLGGVNLNGATNATFILANVQTNQSGLYAVLVTNNSGSTLSANATLTVNVIPPCDPPPLGLVSRWQADGNVFDSGSTNNGVAVGGLSYTAGEIGLAFSFNGVNSIQLLNPSNLSLQNFTIETWLQRTSSAILNGGQDEFIFGAGSGGYGFGLHSDGRLFLSKIDNSYVDITNGLSDAAWHHVAVTKTGSAVVFYIDGVANPAAAFNPTFTNSAGVGIGNRGDNLVTGFFGSIDDLTIYNLALTAAQVQQIFAAAVSGKCPLPPTIITRPVSQTIDATSNVTFSVLATGTPTLKYQWMFNGTNAIGGATNTTLSLTNVGPVNAGIYSIIVTNQYGAAVSSNAVLTVSIHPPVITSPPVNAAVYPGLSAGFSVTATGTLPLNYQWAINGTNIPGATNSAFNINSAQLTDAGNYTVTVTNLYGTAASNCTLTVLSGTQCDPPPSGIVSLWRGEGDASDSASINNGNLVNGVTFVPGEVGQAFAFDGNNSAVTLGNPTNLQLQNFTIEMWVQRDPSTIVSGGNDEVMFSAGSFGYVFLMKSDGRLNLTSGSANSTTTSAGGVSDANWHHVAMTKTGVSVMFYIDAVAYSANFASGFAFNTIGSGFAIGARAENLQNGFVGIIDEPAVYNRALSALELQVIYMAGANGKCGLPPTIVTQPVGQTVIAGNSVNFSVFATGSAAFMYQWIFNGTNPIVGATNSTLTLDNVQSVNAGNYSVIISNLYGAAVSSNAALTVLLPGQCDPPPVGMVSWWRGEGNALDTGVANNGFLTNGVLYVPGMVGQAFSLSGNSSAVLFGNPVNLQLQNFTIEMWIKRSASAIVSNASDEVMFSWGSGGYGFGMKSDGRLFLTKLDASSTMIANAVADTNWHHVAVTKSGTSVFFYIDGVAYSGGIFNLTFTFFATGDGVAIGARGDNQQSGFAGLIDEPAIYNRALNGTEVQYLYLAGTTGKCGGPPVIVTQPATQTIDASSNVTFSASITGAPGLQWYFNATNLIVGATNTTLTLTNVQPVNSGLYSITATNLYGMVVSSNAVLTVLTHPPTIITQPFNATVYSGLTGGFSVAVTGPPPFNYQWTFNGSSISGATNTAFNIASVQSTDVGTYTVIVTNLYGTVTSTNVTFTILSPTQCDPPLPGLVSWWKGEGNALDAVSTNKGLPTNGVTYAPGKVGQAFAFTTTNGIIRLGKPTNLRLQNFTIEMWLQRPASAIVSNASDEFMFSSDSGGYSFGMKSDGRLLFTNVSFNSTLIITNGVSDTNWHHVAVTKDGTAITFYIDGVVYSGGANNVTYNYGQIFNGFAIGLRLDNLKNNFAGLIDELAIYNRALSPAEIQVIYAGGAAGKCGPSVAFTTQPVSQLVMTNCSASFSVAASGGSPLTYQWWKDNSALPGQTNTSLSISSVQSSDFGTYFATASNPFGSSTASSNMVLALDHAPVAAPATVKRFASGGVIIPVATLLTNDTDTDGDVVTITGVSPTTTNGTVSLLGNFVYYTPAAGYTNSDVFTYTITDGHCSAVATGFVTVQVQPDNTPAGIYTIREQAGGFISLTFSGGIPNRSYRIQYTGSLSGSNWQDLTNLVSDGFGAYTFTDNQLTNSTARYYRAISP